MAIDKVVESVTLADLMQWEIDLEAGKTNDK
jgi:hypothetical protein